VRLVSMIEGTVRTGLVVGEEIVDLTDPAIGLPADMVALLALGQDALGALRGAPATLARRRPLSEAHLAAPVPRPPSFLAIARNRPASSARERPSRCPGSRRPSTTRGSWPW
jgi:hypothetical protein